MNLRKRLRDKIEFQAGALNDILFILLLFFLIVSTLANPNVIKLTQPKSNSDAKVKQTLVISIDAEKKYFVSTQQVLEKDLKDMVQIFMKNCSDPNPSIVINADKTVPIQNVVFVMNVAKELGIRPVLAVQKP